MHAETTSEKIALSYYLDGRVAAVIGTHTHVQTADERILARRHGVPDRRRHDRSPRRRDRHGQGRGHRALRHRDCRRDSKRRPAIRG